MPAVEMCDGFVPRIRLDIDEPEDTRGRTDPFLERVGNLVLASEQAQIVQVGTACLQYIVREHQARPARRCVYVPAIPKRLGPSPPSARTRNCHYRKPTEPFVYSSSRIRHHEFSPRKMKRCTKKETTSSASASPTMDPTR